MKAESQVTCDAESVEYILMFGIVTSKDEWSVLCGMHKYPSYNHTGIASSKYTGAWHRCQLLCNY